nr:hypothetical protein [Brachyspira hyodysenteriae]
MNTDIITIAISDIIIIISISILLASYISASVTDIPNIQGCDFNVITDETLFSLLNT